jgi:Peptidase family M28
MADDELVQRAKVLIDRLCERPRFAGSAEESSARDLCQRELEGAGFDCRQRSFDYSQWPGRWGPPLSAAVQVATILIVTRTAMVKSPLLAIIVGGALIAALILVDAYAKRRWITNFPAQRARSVNLEAKRGTPLIWLVAHLDSKSQTVPMLYRIAGSIAVAGILILTVALLLLSLLGLHWTSRLWAAVQIVAIISALPGLACYVRNASSGAVDNASGVVAVLLASQSPAAPRDLGVLITSGEELGLAGSRAWAISAPKELRILNCDTVDDAGHWRCMYSGAKPKQLTQSARRVADGIAARLRITRVIPGILADNIPFADRGIAAITISRGRLGTLARIHTRRDTSNALTGKGAAEASALLSALAKELA